MVLLLKSRDDGLNVRHYFCASTGLRVGIVTLCSGGAGDFDPGVHVFTAAGYEDPVTGSLNEGIAK
jgi:hypothetical protein